MNQANQQVVNQNANITLINIRQAEISYFCDFYSNFGTQCFLLAGVLAGSISQTPSYECASDCNYFWQILYNTSAALCLALTCLVLIATVFISVFGQGLAIRGPPGSMVTTIEGMIAEQRNIVTLFTGVVASYMVQCVGMYFVVMDWEWALVCSVLTGIGTYIIYYYSVRIYNRFNYDQTKSGWNFDRSDDQDKQLSELSPEVLEEVLNNTPQQQGLTSSKIKSLYQESIQKGLIHESDSNEKKRSVLLNLMNKVTSPTNRTSTKPAEVKVDNEDTPYREMMDDDSDRFTPRNKVHASHEGYLTVKVVALRGPVLGVGREKWTRYYFILRGNHLYYYTDRKAYERNPAQPINSRPIDLEGYELHPAAPEPPFAISLVPASSEDIRKTWKFRCDTITEMNKWIEIFQKAIPKP